MKKDVIKMAFDGGKLRQARIAANVTVKDISTLLVSKGIKAAPATIYSWENNNSQPTPDALCYMCNCYGITDPLTYFGYRGYMENDDQSENRLLCTYRELNEEGQEKLLGYADDLAGMPKYKKRCELCLDKKEA